MNTAGTTIPRSRRGLDLGKRNPDCTAPYHGTAATYVHHKCRCDHALADYRNRRKRWGTSHAQPGFTSSIGTRRRLQALAAIGWRWSDLGDLLGTTWQAVQYIAAGHHPTVWTSTADRVEAVYELLSGTPGPSPTARHRAAAKGWAPPLGWDDDQIDNPDARPCVAPQLDEPVIDPERIRRAYAGQRVNLTPEEKAAAVRAGLERGLALTAVAAALHMSNHTAKALAA